MSTTGKLIKNHIITSRPHILPSSFKTIHLTLTPTHLQTIHLTLTPTHLQTILLTLTPYTPPDYTSHSHPLPTSRLYISPSPPTHLQTIHLTLTPYPPPDYTSHPHPLPTSRLYISPSPPTHLQTIHLTLTPYPPPDYTSHPHPLPTSRLYISPHPLPTSRLYILPSPLPGIHYNNFKSIFFKLLHTFLSYQYWVHLCITPVKWDSCLCCILFQLVKCSCTKGVGTDQTSLPVFSLVEGS